MAVIWNDLTLPRKSEGKSKGLFREVIGLVDKYDMWKVTADSLKEDLKRAQGGGLFGVADASHYYLTITTKGRTLKADFYGPDSFSSHYPEAKQLAAFDFVTKFIIQKTEEREQAGAGHGERWVHEGGVLDDRGTY